MSEIKQAWVISHPEGMASSLEPHPALWRTVHGHDELALYNRRDKCFERFEGCDLDMPQIFDTFDECRIEIIAQQMQALRDTREHAHQLASRIEHVKSLPIATFPDAPQIQEQQQAEQVKPAAPAPQQIKRPTRKN